MFNAKTNDGYYDLGLKTAEFIRQAVHKSRSVGDVPSNGEGDTKGGEGTQAV